MNTENNWIKLTAQIDTRHGSRTERFQGPPAEVEAWKAKIRQGLPPGSSITLS